MSRTILVTGGYSGLGKAIILAMKNDPSFSNDKVFAFDKLAGDDVRYPLDTCVENFDVDILINCAGINITGWLESFEESSWDAVMDINAKGIFTMSKFALPGLIKRRGTILNIVSNASHMPMTCSIAYNASKGAAHIMTLQMARELTKKYGITVFGISPNKLKDTGMSRDIEKQVVRDRGWTAEEAAAYQRNALLTGEETDPAQLAEFIAFLLSTKDRHKFLSGTVIPYGA